MHRMLRKPMHLERARAILAGRITNPSQQELAEAQRIVAQAGGAGKKKQVQRNGTRAAGNQGAKEAYSKIIRALDCDTNKIYWFFHVLLDVKRKRGLVDSGEFFEKVRAAGVPDYARILRGSGVVVQGDKVNLRLLNRVIDDIHKNWGEWRKSIS